MNLRDQHLRFSDVVSLALNPSAMTGVFLCTLAARYEQSGIPRAAHALLCIAFTSLVPIGVIFLLKSRGALSDVEMSVRPERDRVYLLCDAGYATGAGLLFLSGAAWPVWGFVALHVPNTLILLACNRLLKVSIHTMVLTSLYVGALEFFGMQTLPLGILVVAAAWARWDAGNHSFTELICGVSMGAVLTSLELQLLHSAFGGEA
jgi:membrane-associated phospholipid phosphatase